MQYYKITKLVMVKLHETHIPYFGYLVVTGPKGGKYIIDEFNSQFICRGATDGKSFGLHEAVIIKNYAAKNNLISYTKVEINDEKIKRIAGDNAAKLLQRQKGITQATYIGKGLKPEERKAIYDEAVQYLLRG